MDEGKGKASDLETIAQIYEALGPVKSRGTVIFETGFTTAVISELPSLVKQIVEQLNDYGYVKIRSHRIEYVYGINIVYIHCKTN